ncbi:MAG TPA: tetratricopeptide repeat protein, partial [Acidocella sp.]|nr:tetratricopeptide repeat protein [Acidocella sp.]
MVKNLLALALFVSMLPIGAAQGQPLIQSQEGIALENQILQLQSQLQQFQAGGGNSGGSALGGGSSAPAPSNSGSTPNGSLVANLLNQVGQLQTQIQQLNGKVDTLQNQVDTQNAATEKAIGDLNFKLSNGASPTAPGQSAGAPQMLAPAPPASTAPSASRTTAAPALSGSPAAVLRAGQVAYDKHNYATAEAAARSVLANAKSSPEGYKAQYLLAQALAGGGKPQDAAIAYDDAYNRDRAGTLAPQSLLGLANSLADINQNEAAC